MSNKIEVKKLNDYADMEKAFAIRREVFVEEQHCPHELEWEFEEESVHFLAVMDKNPAGTARWRQTSNGYKLERFAVLKPFRGLGVGKALLNAILADLPQGAATIYLHAQVTAMEFYATFGFQQLGEPFEEAGILHYKMMKI